MKAPTINRVKRTIEKPHFMYVQCNVHRFYIRRFKEKIVLVYAERVSDKKSEIKCYGYMEERPFHHIKNK